MDDVQKGMKQSFRQLVFGFLLVGLSIGSAIINKVDFGIINGFNFVRDEMFIAIFLSVVFISLVYLLLLIWIACRGHKDNVSRKNGFVAVY